MLAVVDSCNLKYHISSSVSDKQMDADSINTDDKVRHVSGIGANAHSSTSTSTTKVPSSTIGSNSVQSNDKISDANEAIKQIAYADRIVLNKADLLTEDNEDDLMTTIRAINRSAMILPCTYGKLPLSDILNLNCFNTNNMTTNDLLNSNSNSNSSNSTADNEAGGDGYCQPIQVNRKLNRRKTTRSTDSRMNTSSSISSGIDTYSVSTSKAFDFNKLNMWLVTLLQDKGADIYRMKGNYSRV